VVLQRLTSSGPSDRVAKALTALGRLVKTRNILRYLGVTTRFVQNCTLSQAGEMVGDDP
jgi:TnpA family transposase